MPFFILHTKQPWPWGCMHCSMYSLTMNPKFLEADMTDCSNARFNVLCQQLGYYLHPVWVDGTLLDPAPARVWESLVDALRTPENEGRIIPLLLCIDSIKYPSNEGKHVVACVLEGRGEGQEPTLQILDPGQEEMLPYPDLAALLRSQYGRAYEIVQVLEAQAVLDHTPPLYGPAATHVPDEVRQQYEQGGRCSGFAVSGPSLDPDVPTHCDGDCGLNHCDTNGCSERLRIGPDGCLHDPSQDGCAAGPGA